MAEPEAGKSAPEEKAKKKKGKKKSAGPDVLWTVKVERQARAAWAILRQILSGLRSPDAPTRNMAAVFVVSVAGLLVVFGMSWDRYRRLAQIRASLLPVQTDAAKNMSEFFGRQQEEAKRKMTTTLLGQFTVELKKVPGAVQASGVLNMAEIELIAECDVRETCDFLESALDQARNQVTNVLTALDRDELLTREGKRRIKKAVLEKINLWLPKGKIENVYFSRLFVS